jgi:predicted Zn-dependent protease
MHDAYSREFESEADDYAIRLLREADISPQRLADALSRLSHEHGDEEGLKYLSSHPSSRERIRKAEEASQ